jgi:hypothetical protein
MKPRDAILATLALSAAFAADSENLLYDVHENPELRAVFAASDNILFDVTSPTAQQEAAAVLGTREIHIAPLTNGTAAANDFILLSKLRAGDTGPTPEAVTEDTTFDNGTVVSNQTGVNNGSKTWDIEGSADDPAIAMLIDHCRLPGYGTTEKRGKSFAYIAFNEDRSSFSGTAKVNTATAPREGAQRWTFTIVFEVVELRRPAQNPVAGSAGIPAAADITPDSGPEGATVTVTGVNLNVVSAVRLGAQSITTFSTQTTATLAFAVPVAAPLGPKTVTLVYNTDDEVYAGQFEVTAA